MEFKQFSLVTQVSCMAAFYVCSLLLAKGKVLYHSWQTSVWSVLNQSLRRLLENLLQFFTMLDILHTEMASQSFTVHCSCLDHYSCVLHSGFFLWFPSFLYNNSLSGYTTSMKTWPITRNKQPACRINFKGKISYLPLSHDITGSCLLLKLTITLDSHSHPKMLLSYHESLQVCHLQNGSRPLSCTSELQRAPYRGTVPSENLKLKASTLEIQTKSLAFYWHCIC